MSTTALRLLSLTLLFTATSIHASTHKENNLKVFYGADDRLDYYQVPSSLQAMGEAVLGVIDDEDMQEVAARNINGSLDFILNPKKLKNGLRLCDGARFADQIIAANCTAFLISPDIAITAGHCVRSVNECANRRFVKDYRYQSAFQVNGNFVVNENNMARCTEILSREQNQLTGMDYAIVRLDKKIPSKFYFKFRTEGKIADNAKLTVLGHPSGLPLKYTPNSLIRSNIKDEFFVMEADTFSGNSGSPVVDSVTGIVEGVLVRGENDYVPTSKTCFVVKSCKPGTCRGEDVVRITKLPLKALGLSHNK